MTFSKPLVWYLELQGFIWTFIVGPTSEDYSTEFIVAGIVSMVLGVLAGRHTRRVEEKKHQELLDAINAQKK